jgi:two-component system, chemotaxis family, chemotaxis protein CheY
MKKSETDSSKRQIIVIDDDEMSHYIFKAILSLQDSSVTIQSFMSGTAALNAIAANEFKGAAIILDISMPLMSGFDFLVESEKHGIDIPVFIMSSSDDRQDRVKAATFKNIKGFFQKPASPQQIRQVLDVI